MKNLILLLSMFSIAQSAFAADNWYGCMESKIREEVEECSKSKSPADMMKFFEEMTIPFQKSNEVRDKNNALQSIELTKSPGSATAEEINYLFKDQKQCDTFCGKKRAKAIAEQQAKKTKDDKKFDDYK